MSERVFFRCSEPHPDSLRDSDGEVGGRRDDSFCLDASAPQLVVESDCRCQTDSRVAAQGRRGQMREAAWAAAAAAATVAAARVSAGCAVAVGAGPTAAASPLVPLTHACRSFYFSAPATAQAPRDRNWRHRLSLLQPQPRHRRRVLSVLPPGTLPPTATTTTNTTITTTPSRFLATRFPAISCRRRLYSTAAKMSEVQWPAQKVRKTFFEYFEQRGHAIGKFFWLLDPSPPALQRPRAAKLNARPDASRSVAFGLGP